MTDISREAVESSVKWLRGEAEKHRSKHDALCQWYYEAADTLRALLAALEAERAEGERLREDAERWRALWSSERFKMIGSANIDHKNYPDLSAEDIGIRRNEWVHFGLEVWDKHPVITDPEFDDQQGHHGRALLLAYVEHRRAALSREPRE